MLQPSLIYAELDLDKPPTTGDPSASADTAGAGTASSGIASDAAGAAAAAGDDGDTAAKGSTLEHEVGLKGHSKRKRSSKH